MHAACLAYASARARMGKCALLSIPPSCVCVFDFFSIALRDSGECRSPFDGQLRPTPTAFGAARSFRPALLKVKDGKLIDYESEHRSPCLRCACVLCLVHVQSCNCPVFLGAKLDCNGAQARGCVSCISCIQSDGSLRLILLELL